MNAKITIRKTKRQKNALAEGPPLKLSHSAFQRRAFYSEQPRWIKGTPQGPSLRGGSQPADAGLPIEILGCPDGGVFVSMRKSKLNFNLDEISTLEGLLGTAILIKRLKSNCLRTDARVPLQLLTKI